MSLCCRALQARPRLQHAWPRRRPLLPLLPNGCCCSAAAAELPYRLRRFATAAASSSSAPTSPSPSPTAPSSSSRTTTTTPPAPPAQPSPSPPSDYAILGGGITGLATAFYLSKALPHAAITLYEASPRVGGWIQSALADVGTGDVLFERGPRSLRPQAPNGPLGIFMAQELGLLDDLLITPYFTAAAQRRYVYYPDHLVRMPGPGMGMWEMAKTVWFEPVFLGVLSAVMGERSVPTRPASMTDESIGDFVSRRLSKDLADNLVSAVFHGIYAGDIYRLSAKTILPLYWAQEEKCGTLTASVWRKRTANEHWVFMDDMELNTELSTRELDSKTTEMINDASVYSFRCGMEQLAEGLERWLEARPNVKIHRHAKVTDLVSAPQNKDTLELSVNFSGSSDASRPEGLSLESTSNVISTIPSPASGFLSPKLVDNPTSAVTVCVVNLYYVPNEDRFPSLLPTGKYPDLRGFGYLIPQTVEFSKNPERALGVIFDSEIAPDHYTTVPQEKVGPRLTVMLGGHWWDGWVDYPTNEEAIDMAQKVLARHLGIMKKPVLCQAKLQRDCIPQYHVGHSQQMLDVHNDLLDRWKGKVRVGGSWYTGVGLNDCIRSAYDVTSNLAKEANAKRTEMVTGLERVAKKRKMGLVQTSDDVGCKVVTVIETD